MNHFFQSSVTPPASRPSSALWFALKENRVLLHTTGNALWVPRLENFEELNIEYTAVHYLGVLGESHCYAVQLSHDHTPAGMAFKDLRTAMMALDESFGALAGRAFQIIQWDRTHQFCGQCGGRTDALAGERARKCSQCGLLQFPRLSPAIIVLVRRGKRLLLARSRQTPPGMYSILAGFVEPGETLEQAVEREVKEEVGISVRNIRYFGSQPWPFPHSLMIGFTADHAEGELEIDRNEMEDAGWYSVDRLPMLPPPISIARRLIDDFLRNAAREQAVTTG
jgi:NAD+ diphosphatase